jgi:hypothetical protein
LYNLDSVMSKSLSRCHSKMSQANQIQDNKPEPMSQCLLKSVKGT